MPPRSYAKKPSYSRRKFPRTRKGAWYNKRYSAIDMGKMALSQIWKLKGLVNSEVLKQDVTYSENSTSVGVADPLTNIAIGDSVSGRTGNSIYVRSMNFKGYLTWNSAGDANQTVRVCVIMDTQQVTDTTPAITDVYNAATPFAHINILTAGRYKVLYNRVFELNVQTPRVHFEINLPMRHHVRYNGSTASDIQKGGLYLMHCSTQAAANYPTLVGESRLSYHDN